MTQICNLIKTTYFSSLSSSVDISHSLVFFPSLPPPPDLFSSQIWDKQSLECLKILTGHTGSVLCLQYDERVIVTGSSDSTVRYVANVAAESTHCTGIELNTASAGLNLVEIIEVVVKLLSVMFNVWVI